MSCTVVTAFYPIKSKFNKSKYMEWGRTFMKIESPVVFFTEAELVSELMTLRENRPIRFITTPFDSLVAWALYKNKWMENYLIDPENSYHTPELYTIWAQKVWFVEEAINQNYFNTDYFFWCDFGAFRDPLISRDILQSFPSVNHFKDDKLLLQAISDLKPSDKIRKEDGIFGETISRRWNETRLVGGLWGGSIKACLKWKDAYHAMLDKYFKVGRFAGKDQMIMLSAYLENPQLAIVVKCTKPNIDEWFFLEHLLSNQNAEFKLNDTYII